MNKKSPILCILPLIGVLFVSGCQSSSGGYGVSSKHAQVIQTATDAQSQAITNTRNSIDDIESSATEASKTNQAIRTAPTVESAHELAAENQTRIDSIIKSAESAKTSLIEIKRQTDQIRGQISSIEKIENENFDLIEGGQAEARKSLFSILRWFFAAGVAAAIAGVVVSFYSPKTGLLIGGVGVLTTAIAAAGIYYLKWLAVTGLIVAGVGLFVVLGSIVYMVWRARIDKETAQVNTEMLEMLKDDLPDDLKAKYFGTDDKFGVAEIAQSKPVQKNIQKIKSKFDPASKQEP